MWQSIESAPKDGTSIIAFFPKEDKYGVENFCHETIAIVEYVTMSNKFYISSVNGYEYETDIDYSSGPTHWMPLPEAP